MKVRIYYHDTDSGGVVYYANYLKFLEEARTDFFEARGLSIKKLADEGVFFVVARQEIDYKFPARYGDVLEIETAVGDVGAAKIVFTHTIKKEGAVKIAVAKTTLVCVDTNFKPMAMPERVKRILGTE